MKLIVRTAAALLLALPAVPAQDASSFQPPQAPRWPKASELELRYFEPRHVDAEQLYFYAHGTLARPLSVAEGDGARPIDTIGRIGRRIVLYDEPARVEMMLQRLRDLDAPPEADDANRISREYAPRFVALKTAWEALEPFEKRGARNVFAIEGRNTLVLQGTEGEVAEMLAVLARADTPAPEVTLTCYLARQSEAADARLPRELSDNLRVLLPGQEFELAGVGVLRASVVPRREVDLAIDTDTGSSYRLSVRSSAYDSESGTLTAERCELVRTSSAVGFGQPPDQTVHKVFETSAVFRGGEYTVLAATGADPVFLVVRLVPVP